MLDIEERRKRIGCKNKRIRIGHMYIEYAWAKMRALERETGVNKWMGPCIGRGVTEEEMDVEVITAQRISCKRKRRINIAYAKAMLIEYANMPMWICF